MVANQVANSSPSSLTDQINVLSVLIQVSNNKYYVAHFSHNLKPRYLPYVDYFMY